MVHGSEIDSGDFQDLKNELRQTQLIVNEILNITLSEKNSMRDKLHGEVKSLTRIFFDELRTNQEICMHANHNNHVHATTSTVQSSKQNSPRSAKAPGSLVPAVPANNPATNPAADSPNPSLINLAREIQNRLESIEGTFSRFEDSMEERISEKTGNSISDLKIEILESIHSTVQAEKNSMQTENESHIRKCMHAEFNSFKQNFMHAFQESQKQNAEEISELKQIISEQKSQIEFLKSESRTSQDEIESLQIKMKASLDCHLRGREALNSLSAATKRLASLQISGNLATIIPEHTELL